jgi:hypothetical protein
MVAKRRTSRYGESLRHLFLDTANRTACSLEINPRGTHTYTTIASEVTCPRCKETRSYREIARSQKRRSQEVYDVEAE